MTKVYQQAEHAIIFNRVSSVNQDFHSSGEHQYAVCEKYCQNKGLSILGAYGMIETAYKRRRPGFESILGCLEQHHGVPVALVVTSVDRLLRSFCFLDRLNKLREEGRLELHFVEEKLLLSANSTPEDVLMFENKVAEAKYYSAKISETTKARIEWLNEQGIYTREAPIGYTNCEMDGVKWIYPDTQAAKVSHLFEIYLIPEMDIKKLLAVAQVMNLRTSRGKLVSRKTLVALLKREFYCGRFFSRGRFYDHKYHCLVNDMIFYAVQKKLDWELGKVANKETEVQVAA